MPEQTLYIGCHLSAAKGWRAMGETALAIGANTFQFFTRNPRGGAMKPLDVDDANALLALCRDQAFGTLVAHAPYTLNPSTGEPKTRDFAFRCFSEDLARMEALPGNVYNFHPGSHVGQGAAEGIRLTAELLNEVLASAQTTTVLIETMSGHGSEIGGAFEQVAELIARVRRADKLGVCIDTCHLFAAGYDVKDGLDGVLSDFDRIVGLKRLGALHVNDSLYPLGSKKDRHARVGEGYIGLDALKRIVRHEAFKGLPMILETPNEPAQHGDEIRLLRA